MAGNRRGRSERKTAPRRVWRRRVQNGLLVLGGAVVLGLVVLFMVVAGGGGDKTEPLDAEVVETGPGSPQPGSPASGPSLYFPVTDIDFGHVPLDTPVSYSFKYVNMGDAPLTIEGADVQVLEGC